MLLFACRIYQGCRKKWILPPRPGANGCSHCPDMFSFAKMRLPLILLLHFVLSQPNPVNAYQHRCTPKVRSDCYAQVPESRDVPMNICKDIMLQQTIGQCLGSQGCIDESARVRVFIERLSLDGCRQTCILMFLFHQLSEVLDLATNPCAFFMAKRLSLARNVSYEEYAIPVDAGALIAGCILAIIISMCSFGFLGYLRWHSQVSWCRPTILSMWASQLALYVTIVARTTFHPIKDARGASYVSIVHGMFYVFAYLVFAIAKVKWYRCWWTEGSMRPRLFASLPLMTLPVMVTGLLGYDICVYLMFRDANVERALYLFHIRRKFGAIAAAGFALSTFLDLGIYVYLVFFTSNVNISVRKRGPYLIVTYAISIVVVVLTAMDYLVSGGNGPSRALELLLPASGFALFLLGLWDIWDMQDIGVEDDEFFAIVCDPQTQSHESPPSYEQHIQKRAVEPNSVHPMDSELSIRSERAAPGVGSTEGSQKTVDSPTTPPMPPKRRSSLSSQTQNMHHSPISPSSPLPPRRHSSFSFSDGSITPSSPVFATFTVIIRRPYRPIRPGELALEAGDAIYIRRLIVDGVYEAYNERTGETGIVTEKCLITN